MTLASTHSQWLHHDANARSFGMTRAAICLIWIGVILSTPLTDLANTPGFQPVGLLQLLPDVVWSWLMHERGLHYLRLVAIASLLLAIAPWRGRSSALLISAITLTLIHGLMQSFGKVNHCHFGLLYATYAIVLCRPKADRTTDSEPDYAFPLIVVTLILTMTYVFVGFRRVVTGELTSIPTEQFFITLPCALPNLTRVAGFIWPTLLCSKTRCACYYRSPSPLLRWSKSYRHSVWYGESCVGHGLLL